MTVTKLAAVATTRSSAPRELRLSIDGFPGPSYLIELCGDTLIWAHADGDHVDDEPICLLPGERWTSFAATLDELGVWDWAPSYTAAHDPAAEPGGEVVDGVSWRVHISWDGRTVLASGIDTFPPSWDAFCESVERLLGGLSFR
ncbi:MAG: hypothetical protein S0880_27695 [Actinomycetota bacterium]|nr:hypothetical protein [Actinomycetota bacterium]